MPNTNANLQIQPGQIAGWNQIQAQNNPSLWYSYQYTGGTDGHGGMSVTVGQGAQNLLVQLATDNQRYQISDVSFGDPSHQLSVVGSRSGSNINILDKNDTIENGYYGLFVTDSGANGASVYCDPMIKNEGRPPEAQWRRSAS